MVTFGNIHMKHGNGILFSGHDLIACGNEFIYSNMCQ